MSHELAQAVLLTWLKAYLFTLLVEVPIFVLIARRTVELPLWRLALAGAAGTLATHPALWFVWPHLFSDYALYIVTGEILVACIESLTFYALARPISFWTAVAASFVANAASYGVGALVH
jgi:hypothetical protein